VSNLHVPHFTAATRRTRFTSPLRPGKRLPHAWGRLATRASGKIGIEGFDSHGYDIGVDFA
jgi:hypothetical protein